MTERGRMFRAAAERDCKAIYQIICDMEATVLPYDRFEEIYRKQLEDARYECVVCEERQTVVGVLNLRYEEQLHHADWIAEIMEFVVASGYRGRGYGKALFAFACQRARSRNCTQIEVACNQLRKDTHRFYQREGMKNFHYKLSKMLMGADPEENKLGR